MTSFGDSPTSPAESEPISGGVLDGWVRGSFTAADISHETYRRGEGPAVVVVHEVPGITPRVVDFANDVVGRGFTVVMPSLLGTPGRAPSQGYLLRSMSKMCVSKEFAAFAVGRTSPIVAWLRALGRNLHNEVGGAGVGAVGMCFSGGFALGMMIDEIMLAPVLSQPSLPLPAGGSRRADLHLSPDDEAAVVQRAQEGCDVLGLRFTDDSFVGDRFSTLREKLGDAFIAVEIPSTKKSDHSVLTEQRDESSVETVLEFLERKLH